MSMGTFYSPFHTPVGKLPSVLGLNFSLGYLPNETVNYLRVDTALCLTPSGASSVRVSVWHITAAW